MSTTTKVVLGIVGAAAAGVVIGLLVAPEKGSDMRARLSKKTGDWVDQLSSIFSSRDGEMEENENIGKEMPQGA